MSAVLKQPPEHMTVADFVQWDSGDWSGRRWQLVDGVAVAMTPARDAHGSIQAEIARVLGNHLVDRRAPCRVVTEGGVIPRAGAAENFRIPDIAVTCAPPGDAVAVPEPVVLMEILAPGNVAETRANIWAFTTTPSVLEIVLLHSGRIEAEVLRRLPDGTWPDNPRIIDVSGELQLNAIGFSVQLAALYRTTALAG